jgi:hypothetical protein
MAEEEKSDTVFKITAKTQSGGNISIWALPAGRANAVRTLSSEYGEVTVEELPISELPDHVKL